MDRCPLSGIWQNPRFPEGKQVIIANPGEWNMYSKPLSSGPPESQVPMHLPPRALWTGLTMGCGLGPAVLLSASIPSFY